MTFSWPWMLLGLVAVPALVVEYRRLLRLRATRRARLATLGMVAPVAVARGWRRHVTPMLLLLALALMSVALARPQATTAEVHREGTVVLAFDVSSSMAATDVAPSRIEAAKSAARAFVARRPMTIRVGVIAFGESGLIIQRPTTDSRAVTAAIDRLTPHGGTSLGRGLQTSLSLISGKRAQVDDTEGAGSVEATGPDLGYHGSAAVILLSDGEDTARLDPIKVAELASTAGVRIYPIGLGSPKGTVLKIDGFQIATTLDEETLQRIASATDGQYFAATDSEALARVYASIDPAWTVRAEQTEITALFTIAAAVLLLLGAGRSLASFGRVI